MSLFLLPLVFLSPRLFGMSFIASECGRSLQHLATKTCVQCIGTTVTVKQVIKWSWNDHKIKGDRHSVWDHLRQCKVNIYDEKAQLSCGGTCETQFKKQRTKTVFWSIADRRRRLDWKSRRSFALSFEKVQIRINDQAKRNSYDLNIYTVIPTKLSLDKSHA